LVRGRSKAGIRQRVSKHHGGAGSLLPLVAQQDRLAVAEAAGALDPHADSHQRLDAAERVEADAGFAGKHQAIGFLVGGVGHVGDFGAGRRRILDHRFQKLGRDDDPLAELVAALDDAALEDGEFLELDFHAKVAAGDHDHVGGLDDGVDVADGFLVLDLRDNLGTAFKRLNRLPQLADVGGIADERAGDVVGVTLDREGQVDAVLFGEGGEIEAGAGEIDVAAGAEFAGGFHLADDAVVLPDLDLHQHGAVVDDQGAAFGDVVHQTAVVDGGGKLDRGCGIAFAEFHHVADLEFVGLFQVAGADRRAGEVEQHRDVGFAFGGGAADPAGHLAGPVVLRVAHVEPEDVGATVDQLADGFLRLGRGSEGDDDLGSAGHEMGEA
jgi:hypothetical protein